jgi:hypothetical protein
MFLRIQSYLFLQLHCGDLEAEDLDDAVDE